MTNTEIDIASENAWQKRINDLQKSYKEGTELLNLSEKIYYKQGIADNSKTLGYAFWRFSDFSLSLSHSLRALELYQSLGDKKGEADTLNNVGAVYMFQNDNVKRLEVNIRCKELREEVEDYEGVASSEGNIGETYFEMGDYANAYKCFENVLEYHGSSTQGLAWAYHNIGKIKQLNLDWDEAYKYFRKGLTLSVSVNYEVLIIDSYLAITELFLKQKRYSEALDYSENALGVSRNAGAKEGEKKALFYLSKIFELIGKFEESLLYHKRYHVIDVEISRDTEIERLKTTQLKAAYDKIEEQKNELLDSIRYAERIQKAVLTRDQSQMLLRQLFIYFQPKDIVSGDFYWYHEKDSYFYICVADCTGHGVPGAFLTMLGTTYLNEIIASYNNPTPAFILEQLRTHLISALSQNSTEVTATDGMDVSLLRYDVNTKSAVWAGANNPVWIIRKNNFPKLITEPLPRETELNDITLYEIKGDKIPVGIMDELMPFSNHKFKLYAEDTIYLFSDGYVDQFGGKKNKKFRSGNLKTTLLELESKKFDDRSQILQDTFEEWKGNEEQVDDVCILGFQINTLGNKNLG